MCIGEALQKQVREYQQSTGEESLVVVIEKSDETMAVHHVAFNPYLGLLVDGKPPSPRWWQEAEDFHALQWTPTVVH